MILHRVTRKHVLACPRKRHASVLAPASSRSDRPYPTTERSIQRNHTGHRATNAPSGDIRLALWSSLLEAGGQQLKGTLHLLSDALNANITRLRRLTLDPPPPGFPPGPSGDQVVSLLNGPLAFLNTTRQQYGSIVGLLLGGERVVLVSDPQAAKQVLIEQADVFIKEGTAFFPGSSLTGNGLLVSDGDTWQRQRRLSNPAFRKAAVEAYAAAMVTTTADMLSRQWRSGGVRDVYADFNELTLRITLEALFGFSTQPSNPNSSGSSSSHATGADDAAAVVSAVATAFEFFTRRAGSGMVLPEWLPTWDNLQFNAAVSQLDAVVYGLIAQRRAELADASSKGTRTERKDLLQSLLTVVDEDGSGMTDIALRDELMTLLVAGQETSAILLGWVCALLAHHPAAQKRAAQEVSAVLQDRQPRAADVRSLPYLEAVLLETLRLYPPAYMVGRCASRDAQVSGYSVVYSLPAGTTALVSPFLMHRDPAVWGPDAGDFKPERWAVWQSKPGYTGFMSLLSGMGPTGSFVPFGAGPRNCIGTGFAMMEGVLVLASMLQRYQLAPVTPEATFPSPKPLITLRPDAVPLRLTMR